MTPIPRREIAADRPAGRSLRKEVRGLLHGGELVGLPTETVYGIAARADLPAALERLERLKERGADRAFTWHVTRLDALEAFPHLAGLVRRVAERYWPGPLTLVLRGVPRGLEHAAREGWTGLRLPAHEATRSLLEFADFPVVMTSANRNGATPLATADAIAGAFDGELALLVDGGSPRLGESSTVLQVGPGCFQVLREGLISAPDLRRAAGLSLGFVCSGNTCRSPMAAALAGRALAARLGIESPDDARAALSVADFGFELHSAGVHAGSGSPASEHAVQTMDELGLDVKGHRSRPAVPEELGGWDHVYCLTSGHRGLLAMELPPSRARRIELLDPSGADIPDPFGGRLEDYRACAERIQACVEARAGDWV